MAAWKYEIFSRVDKDISLLRFARSWDILVKIQFLTLTT